METILSLDNYLFQLFNSRLVYANHYQHQKWVPFVILAWLGPIFFGSKKGSKSFPSNHAANNAAFATVIWLYCGHIVAIPIKFIDVSIGYSRVYLGEPYPFDVITSFLGS